MSSHPQCAICKHHHEFELPDEVLDAAKTQRLVIFAGAGISTEASNVMPYTFYDQIAMELGHNPKTLTKSFPDLMSEYCDAPDGRRKLLKKLKGRLDQIESFPSLLDMATRFHRELSTIPHLDDIITTNWDPYFERFCGATPIVAAHDFVFWDMPGRKVFKIHGSVNSYSSLIATNEDYERCHRELVSGLVGSNLKMLLATKVVLFIGYSLRDHDFSRIYDFLKDEMKGMLPQAYAVTISKTSADRFAELGLVSINTDGVYFLQILKHHLAAAGLAVPDERFQGVATALNRVARLHHILHRDFTYKKNPEVLYCASYQDGLMDAFGRILQRGMTGEYSCPDHINLLVRKYMSIQAEKRSQKKYSDVAYIEGYMNGLLYLVMPNKGRQALPLFFVFGHKQELRTISEYASACKKAKTLHRSAYAEAIKLTRDLEPGVVFHHTPFLL